MIAEDRRNAVARVRATLAASQVEQALVLAAGISALLLLLVV